MGKFNYHGREVESWNLSNNELVEIMETTTFLEEKKDAINCIIERFKHYSCKRNGETNDELFARQFSEFVNGKMNKPEHVAEQMAKDHRYLQQEMFKVCLEYIEQLYKSYQNNFYDPRNEWACKMSNSIIEHLKNTKQLF